MHQQIFSKDRSLQNSQKVSLAADRCCLLAAYLGNEARALLKSLLQREPAHRLGYGPTGSQDVQKHPFFRSINWNKLREGAVASPFKPTVKQDDSYSSVRAACRAPSASTRV